MATQLARSEPRDTSLLLASLKQVGDQIRYLELERSQLLPERDNLIRQLVEAGFSEREIARAAGVTGPRINQMKKAMNDE